MVTLQNRVIVSLSTRPIYKYKYVCHFFVYLLFFFPFILYFLIQCLASLWVNFSSVVVSEIYCVMDILVVNAALSKNRHGEGQKWLVTHKIYIIITKLTAIKRV